MSTVTGNEPIHAFTLDNGFKVQYNEGEMLRQIALREFMCAIVAMGTKNTPSGIARDAESLTNAYINQLNNQ